MPAPKKAGSRRSPICFEDQTSDTLLVDGKKVVGCAQTRRRQSVLIHAAVLLGLDEALYLRWLSHHDERVADAEPGVGRGAGDRFVGSQHGDGLQHHEERVDEDHHNHSDVEAKIEHADYRTDAKNDQRNEYDRGEFILDQFDSSADATCRIGPVMDDNDPERPDNK